jgi:ankyrin repeat protein
MERGADANAVDSRGQTALHIAAENSHQPGGIIQQLLRYGAKINVTDKQGRTPLMSTVSCRYPRSDCIDVLLQHQANTDMTDSSGMTALHHVIASDARDKDVVAIVSLVSWRKCER